MMDQIFDWCVNVLVCWAGILGITYKEINVWVFVMLWPQLTEITFHCCGLINFIDKVIINENSPSKLTKGRIHMETTMQSSPQGFRSKIAAIEAIELGLLGFALWCFSAIVALSDPDVSFLDQIVFLVITQGILLGSWTIYNVYIRVARAGGRLVDIGIWVIATALTSSYTFWAWSILDLNRLLMSKLFYRGEAPVELAWSWRSKQVRKAWEQARKAGYA